MRRGYNNNSRFYFDNRKYFSLIAVFIVHHSDFKKCRDFRIFVFEFLNHNAI